MSQISVVQYNASPKSNNVLQQITATNQSSGDNRHIIVLRKPTTKDDILITNPGRKGYKKTGKEVKTSPQPIAVARRNARERNRVKQVNNGFANLRQHIPNFIAQAFESNNGRGNKKLSKVETLRMAVEYIRSLEEVLALDGYTLPIEEPKSPGGSNSQSDIGYSFVMSPSDDDDDFSSVATPSPQQYIKINSTNSTFELVPTSLFDNAENLDPMSVEQNQLLLDSGLDLNSQDLSFIQVNPLQTTSGSLSPGMYSEGSLSPSNDKETLPQNCFIPVFATGRLGNNFNVQIKTESEELPLISIKDQEVLQEVHWWDQRQSTSS